MPRETGIRGACLNIFSYGLENYSLLSPYRKLRRQCCFNGRPEVERFIKCLAIRRTPDTTLVVTSYQGNAGRRVLALSFCTRLSRQVQGCDTAVVRCAGRHEAAAPAIPGEGRFRFRLHQLEQCTAFWQGDVRHVHSEGGFRITFKGRAG